MTASSEVPRGAEAVLAAVEQERQALQKWFDQQMRQLDRAAVAVGGEAGPAAPAKAEARPKPKRKAAGSSPGDAKARREQIMEFVKAQGGPVPPRRIRDELGISENSMRTAAAKLIEEGRLIRHGERQFTVYEAAHQRGTAPPAPTPSPSEQVQGTPQGRVLAVIEATGGAATAEIAARLPDLTEAGIEEICGALIREEEVQMRRRDDDRIYVSVGGGA